MMPTRNILMMSMEEVAQVHWACACGLGFSCCSAALGEGERVKMENREGEIVA